MILFFLKEIFQTPAPGTYYPEKVHPPPNEQSAPAFLLGTFCPSIFGRVYELGDGVAAAVYRGDI